MEKVDWLNNVRAFGIVGIILIHVVCGVMVEQFSATPNAYWWIGNVYDSIVRCSVPLFVMITGALFLSKEIKLKPFFQKRFVRILIPFLFWSFVYVLSEAYLSSFEQGTNFFSNIWNSNFIARLLKCGVSYHFWYVYMLISLYLIIPILNRWIRHCTEKEILYFLCIWLIASILNYSFIEYKIFPELKLVYFSGFIGYLVLGYYLLNVDTVYKNKTNGILNFIKNKFMQKKIYSLLLIFAAFLITIFGTYFISIKKGYYTDMFYNYLVINVLMAAVGVFLFIKSCKITNKTFIKTINFLNKYSYGVYLIHLLVLIHLSRFGINAYFIHPLIGIPIITIICLGISVLIIWVVNKLPLGKYISG